MTTVELIRWPAESDRRAALDRAGRPRILVLQGGATPPVCGLLEDWVRPPVSREDLEARAAALQVRAAAPPSLQDRRLCVEGRTLVLTAGEALLAQLLVERFGEVVDRDELFRRLWSDGPTPRRNALDLRVLRLRRRLEPLGLLVRTVWGRGYMLEHATDRAEAALAV